jgi:glycosyltransferase involved in cell wall biosynthesis
MSTKDKIKVVVSYPSHNRLDYCKITLPQVIEEVKNAKNKSILYIGDDNSTDGTWEYINTTMGATVIEQQNVGNSIWQLNKAFDLARSLGADYVYAMANDILMPDGIIDRMVKLMEQYPDACSIMVEECFNMPYIHPAITVEEHLFTSSLGIHRVEAYPQQMVANKRFFGFQDYQRKAIKNHGYAAYRVKGIGNTNLDGSAWSKQEEYESLGYARKGLVGNDKSVYKFEKGQIE